MAALRPVPSLSPAPPAGDPKSPGRGQRPRQDGETRLPPPQPERTASGRQGLASLAAAWRGGPGHTQTHATPWSQADGRGGGVSWGRVPGVSRPGPAGKSDFRRRDPRKSAGTGWGILGSSNRAPSRWGLLKGQGPARGPLGPSSSHWVDEGLAMAPVGPRAPGWAWDGACLLALD